MSEFYLRRMVISTDSLIHRSIGDMQCYVPREQQTAHLSEIVDQVITRIHASEVACKPTICCLSTISQDPLLLLVGVMHQ